MMFAVVLVTLSISALAENAGRSAEIMYQNGGTEVHHKIFGSHAGDIMYSLTVDGFHRASGISLDLLRLKIDTIDKIVFVDMTAEDQARYPQNMDPSFIRKGNVTFSGKKQQLNGIFLGVGMIKFYNGETYINLITPNVSAVRFLPSSRTK